MEKTDHLNMLDLMVSPVFLVKDRYIQKANPAATRLLVREGSLIDDLLITGHREYGEFTGGCLYVTIDIVGEPWGACITKTPDGDVFALDQQWDSPELQAMALAARELRSPLSDAMTAAQTIAQSNDPRTREAAAHLNRKLYQLLRLVGNMSDAAVSTPLLYKENRDLNALFREASEKAASLAEAAGITVHFEGLSEPAVSGADAQQLERALMNMVSNAIKFTPRGGTIRICLSRSGKFLLLRVTDNGTGIPEELRGTIFRRYLRQPVIEDSRHGIGLGMLLIRSAAANHGGTVLVDHPEGTGTRVTMTIALREEPASTFHSTLQVDYAGERDHGLIELSDCLPAELYREI